MVADELKPDVEGLIQDQSNLDVEGMAGQFAENLINDTFGELNVMAKQTINTAFSYVLAVFLFAFQIINKEQPVPDFDSLNITETFSLLTNTTTAFTTNAFVFDKRTEVPFYISCGCAAYGSILSMMVLYKARNSSKGGEFNSSTISKLYEFTDKIPIIDSILEIPVALSQEFWITIFLWVASLTVSVALLVAFLWNGSDLEGTVDAAIGRFEVLSPSDLATELYSNLYAGYLLLFRLTGDVSQFYVLEQAHKKFEREN